VFVSTGTCLPSCCLETGCITWLFYSVRVCFGRYLWPLFTVSPHINVSIRHNSYLLLSHDPSNMNEKIIYLHFSFISLVSLSHFPHIPLLHFYPLCLSSFPSSSFKLKQFRHPLYPVPLSSSLFPYFIRIFSCPFYMPFLSLFLFPYPSNGAFGLPELVFIYDVSAVPLLVNRRADFSLGVFGSLFRLLLLEMLVGNLFRIR
jgi:hypothetical protein